MWEAAAMSESAPPEPTERAASDAPSTGDTTASRSADPSPPPPVLRGLARLLDLGVQVAILELAFRARPYLPIDGLVPVQPGWLVYVDLAVGLGSFWVYCTVSEALAGATLGKVVTGMRTVRAADGGPISVRASAIRNAMFFVGALLFGMVAYSQMARSAKRQRGGDVAAGTMVKWVWHTTGRSTLWGWPLGVAAGFLVVWLSYVTG